MATTSRWIGTDTQPPIPALAPKAMWTVRRNPSLFLVIPDHVDDQIEDVVEVCPGYVIVSKNGVAAQVAHLWTLRDGKGVRIRVLGRDEALEAAGLRE